jgi:hypothetical protein
MKSIVNKFFSLLFVTSGMLAVCSSCTDDTENYDNKAFVTTSKVNNILLKGTNDEGSVVIKTEIAKLEAKEIKVVYKADASLVSEYNQTYGEKAIIVPSDNYEIPQNTSTIMVGATKGDDIKIHFKGLSTLDRSLVYVLPVTVSESNIAFLTSTRTTYCVIKGGALINTAANITKNNLSLQSPGTSTLKSLNQLTVEALVRIDKFGKLISTFMGIEGGFLFRFGDAGVPDNQLQLATSSGNITDATWQVPTNEWVQLAVTFNSTNGEVELYLNGVKKGSTLTTNYRRAVNWATSDFYIGKSYDDNRWLEGDICECRVWNRVLTADEIKAKEHFYVVAPNSEGLVAYWKFDEGIGKLIADHTGNGNAIVASDNITWKTVSLPK